MNSDGEMNPNWRALLPDARVMTTENEWIFRTGRAGKKNRKMPKSLRNRNQLNQSVDVASPNMPNIDGRNNQLTHELGLALN